MKLTLTLLALSLSSVTLYAQNGAISTTDLNEIKSSFTQDATTKALRNAIRSNSNLKTLALNTDVAGTVDNNFKYKVTLNKTITNQLSSGRCWMFTSMNVLRPQLVEKYNLKSFDFSQNFNYFWDLFEKSNLFLENIIATASADMDDREVVCYFQSPIDDGGVWNHFYNVSKKYGVVPKSVMPETVHSNNTSSMVSILKERLRKGGFDIREAAASGKKASALEDIKISVMKDVYRVLALCLGEPPVEFDWKYVDADGEVKVVEGLTPEKFFADIVPENYTPDNYVMVMNDPTREYYKVYDIKNYRNTQEGTNWVYLNLPNEDIKAAAMKSIKGDDPMYASCDVGKEFNRSEGLLAMDMYDLESLLGIDLSMDKRARILSRHSGSSHAMTLVAFDTDSDDKPVKWQFENSWGSDNANGGYLTFTDSWFDNYLFRLVVKREYLDSRALKALDSSVVDLPIWDYMF
ncbi:MAG: C1 family peptidase [Rikenellaceae bacterium]